jgi:hypothetical protein
MSWLARPFGKRPTTVQNDGNVLERYLGTGVVEIDLSNESFLSFDECYDALDEAARLAPDETHVQGRDAH